MPDSENALVAVQVGNFVGASVLETAFAGCLSIVPGESFEDKMVERLVAVEVFDTFPLDLEVVNVQIMEAGSFNKQLIF